MFKELLKAKRKYYGKYNYYPTAIKLNEQMWTELKMEGKALSMNTASSFSSHSVNGMEVFIDNDVKDFEFGFHFNGEFSKEVF